MVLGITGPRPVKLYGYDLENPHWKRLKELFKQILKENNCEEAVTGMAPGVDTVWALAVLEIRDEGYNIKLHCAIPCKNYSCKWPYAMVIQYTYILSKADTVKLISDEDYKPRLMQRRNEYIVDIVDKLIAVWDNTITGENANCIKYAQKVGREILRLDTTYI